MASEQELRDELYTAMKALGPNPPREKIQAVCAAVLTRHMPKPEVDQLSIDPDGTVHFTMKWAFPDETGVVTP